MSCELTKNVIATAKVQEGDGCFTVTLPKDPAMDMGVKPGDTVVFTGVAGDDGLQIRKSDELLSRLD